MNHCAQAPNSLPGKMEQVLGENSRVIGHLWDQVDGLRIAADVVAPTACRPGTNIFVVFFVLRYS